jgi:hypothetical protein
MALIIMLELCSSMVAACIPTMGPLITNYVKPMISRFSTKSSTPESSPNAITLNTIGSKPSRRANHDLGSSQRSLLQPTYADNPTQSKAERSDVENVYDVKESQP